MRKILSEISGVNAAALPDENNIQNEPDLSVRKDISYAEFKSLMQTADDILGGGSDYASDALIHYGRVPVTYEEAVARYELVKTLECSLQADMRGFSAIMPWRWRFRYSLSFRRSSWA